MKRQIDSQDLNFWRQQLCGNRPMLDLPLDHRRTGNGAYQYDEVPFRISADVLRGIEELAQKQRATPSSLYLAAYAILLSRCGNTQEVLIGLPDAGRALSGDLSPCAFIRVDCRPEQSLTWLIQAIAGTFSSMRRHKVVPLPTLARLLKLSAEPGRGLVCDVCFMGDESTNCIERRRDRAAIPGPRNRTRGLPFPPCDLSLRIGSPHNDTTLWWIYRTDLFDLRSIERMARRLLQLLHDLGSGAGDCRTLGMMPGDSGLPAAIVAGMGNAPRAGTP